MIVIPEHETFCCTLIKQSNGRVLLGASSISLESGKEA